MYIYHLYMTGGEAYTTVPPLPSQDESTQVPLPPHYEKIGGKDTKISYFICGEGNKKKNM
jgi:hypothetical protein